jgi:dTDP-4-amino-4,6-dideoxygalactose transaminase
MIDIPFHRASLGAGERAAVLEVLDSGWLTTGERTVAFEEAVRQAVGSQHAVAVNSATAALHLALEGLGIQAGDEVVVPTYTFASCGEVVAYLGARPRLADVDLPTLNATAETIERQLRPATKAILVVHFGGLMAEMAPIIQLAQQHGLAVVEDAAHALPATRAGRHAGTWGDAGALSFYATKTVTTGEGGMLITDSEALAERARITRLHGISRDAWKRYTLEGSWFYEIERVGYKYNLTDLAAAIGLVQLKRAEEMRRARERIASFYGQRFGELELLELIDLPAVPLRDQVHAWHLYPIRLRTDEPEPLRNAVIEALRADGIGTSVHFIPLHLHPYYRPTFGYEPDDFPIARAEYGREISLPIYPDLTDDAVDRVATSLARILRSALSTPSRLRSG